MKSQYVTVAHQETLTSRSTTLDRLKRGQQRHPGARIHLVKKRNSRQRWATTPWLSVIAPIAGLLGLAFSLYLAYITLKNSPGTADIADISRAIQTGASTFLKREYRVIGLVVLLFAPILALVLDPYVMVTFFVGVLCSALSGVISMTIATWTNSRTTYAARNGLHRALNVDIATKGALGHLVQPCLLAISIPFIIVLVLGKAALAGLLAGCIVTGIFLALFMANAGGAWDNAKKLIEAGQMGGKGSLAHKASVIGDTVGDPLKDTAGPALDILVQLVATVSLAFAPLFLRILG